MFATPHMLVLGAFAFPPMLPHAPASLPGIAGKRPAQESAGRAPKAAKREEGVGWLRVACVPPEKMV